jgi:hypothetical protein
MMESLRTKSLTVSTFDENGSQASTEYAPNVSADATDNDHLATILAFLGREVERSATLLRDLAAGISDDFGVISAAELADDVQERLIAATMALQNEDRLQQRLSDLHTALSILERTLIEGGSTQQTDIDKVIIDKLRLEEMRSAFALSVGLIDAQQQSKKVTNEPTLGDIDLF